MPPSSVYRIVPLSPAAQAVFSSGRVMAFKFCMVVLSCVTQVLPSEKRIVPSFPTTKTEFGPYALIARKVTLVPEVFASQLTPRYCSIAPLLPTAYPKVKFGKKMARLALVGEPMSSQVVPPSSVTLNLLLPSEEEIAAAVAVSITERSRIILLVHLLHVSQLAQSVDLKIFPFAPPM